MSSRVAHDHGDFRFLRRAAPDGWDVITDCGDYTVDRALAGHLVGEFVGEEQ
ncbi:hypothetical protein [Dactylosporangium sp. CA-092794]|uniref:hypothetical protein n=1 Tax=Dactylosporangium sp. CA-092794 TaxID=3239929 RepID=UPI003D8F61D1